MLVIILLERIINLLIVVDIMNEIENITNKLFEKALLNILMITEMNIGVQENCSVLFIILSGEDLMKLLKKQ